MRGVSWGTHYLGRLIDAPPEGVTGREVAHGNYDGARFKRGRETVLECWLQPSDIRCGWKAAARLRDDDPTGWEKLNSALSREFRLLRREWPSQNKWFTVWITEPDQLDAIRWMLEHS